MEFILPDQCPVESCNHRVSSFGYEYVDLDDPVDCWVWTVCDVGHKTDLLGSPSHSLEPQSASAAFVPSRNGFGRR